MKIIISFLCMGLILTSSWTQKSKIEDFEVKYRDWFNKDLTEDQVMGASVDKTYRELLKDLSPKKTVVVAVIDAGVDIHHEDLQGRIWVNTDEIPDNGIDDDHNGYIDDIHGWNFIGNRAGENIVYESYEQTRIVRSKDINNKDYERAKEMYDEALAKKRKLMLNLLKFKEKWDKSKADILEETGIQIDSLQDLKKVTSKKQHVLEAKQFLAQKMADGATEEGINSLLTRTSEYLNYHLNLKYYPRSIIGDDPLDINDKSYGNNDVVGTRSGHGTSSAGAIAAIRDNGIGINGIAENVQIMALRTIPRGDEWDKDVALSIMYAVDNGADIINMSFGKAFSPQREFVDKAVSYAEEKGVLIIHSAGNDAQNIDLVESFPRNIYLDGTAPSHWINVGASQMDLNTEILGIFSNYGAKQVDIFSPGVDVVSLYEENAYKQVDGTSIAGPIVTGVAALILSYYPDLSPSELIEILMASSYRVIQPKKVLIPNLSDEKRKKAKFSTLSKSGGIVNAYHAFTLLAKRNQ